MDGRVSVRAHYERFPATIKGAFVLRGDDADPHQVRLDAARIVECAGGGAGAPMGVEPAVLDVAPHLDLFVPFEVSLLDLGPGWYRIEVDVAVDGDEGVMHPGDRFAMPWPRGSMRRGTADVGRTLSAGDTKVTVERVECVPDSVRISYEAPSPVALSVAADGVTLPVLDETFDEEAGRGTATTYPAAKAQTTLTISARGAGDPLELDLP